MKNKTNYGRKLTTRLVLKIILYSILYTLSFALLYVFLRFICSQFIWYSNDPLYQILTSIGYNFYYMFIIWLVGFIVIVIFCLVKTLSYIDAIVAASSNLVSDDDEWIKLPPELLEIEDKMNLVKETSRRNSRIAKENEQKKNDLIVYLAHDIKTPLTSMIGYLSLLDEIDDMKEDKRKKYINIALEKSYRLEELINELFDITRFNTENIILNKEKINLNMMIEQIVDDFYPTLKDLNKKININSKSNSQIFLHADSDKLARVFNNIIKNAINYSADDSNITIDILKKENSAIISIKNYGKTIPKDKLKKIFEKFYRLDSSRSTKTGGSGLGLAIAKEIVELHNGTITATSSEEETCFEVKLPIS